MCLTLAVAATAAVLSLGAGADTTIAVRPGTELAVANFAGEVTVRSWEKDAVRIQTETGDNVKFSFVTPRLAGLQLFVNARSSAQHSIDLEITAPSTLSFRESAPTSTSRARRDGSGSTRCTATSWSWADEDKSS